MKPKVVLVPFADRYYPREWIDRVIRPSVQLVSSLECDLVVTPPVIVFSDVAQAAEQVRQNPADLVIALVASWLEVVNLVGVLRQVFHKPILLWSHVPFPDGRRKTSLGAFVGAAVARETLEEMGARFKFIYGMPEDIGIKEGIASYLRVAHTYERLSAARIGLFGYTAMGMYTGTFDHVSLRSQVGPEVHHLDQYLLVKKMESIEARESGQVVTNIRRKFSLQLEITDVELDKAAKMTLALDSLARENCLDAINVKCHYELSEDYGFTACVPLSLLSDRYTCSCEGDILATVTQLMLHSLTGEQTVYGDIHQVLSDRITFACCGFNAVGMCDPDHCQINRWASDFEGILNSSTYPPNRRVTLARLAAKGDRYKMHITTGMTQASEPWGEVNCPPLPGTDILLDDSSRWFAQHIASNHYAMVFGDVKEQLVDLCQLLDILPVTAS